MSERIRGSKFAIPPLSGKNMRLLRDKHLADDIPEIKDDLTTMAEWLDHSVPKMLAMVDHLVEHSQPRPINTAPEATLILVWRKKQKRWEIAKIHDGVTVGDEGRIPTPSHWFPLPPAPSNELVPKLSTSKDFRIGHLTSVADRLHYTHQSS